MTSSTGAVLGIDVGFSPKRRSSAVCRLSWTAHEIDWRIERFRATEEDRRRAILSVGGDSLLSAAAFDGPLMPGFGAIGQYRVAERMLTKRLQQRIGKPGQSSAPVGKMLNAAANDCAAAVLRHCRLGPSSHAVRIDDRAIVEAFPSSFLGVMLENPQAIATQRGNRSDVYFVQLSDRLAELLAFLLPERQLRPGLADVTNHDDRAALVCAITALCVARNCFTAVGDDSQGWIILPPRQFIEAWAWADLQANAELEGKGSICLRSASEDRNTPLLVD